MALVPFQCHTNTRERIAGFLKLCVRWKNLICWAWPTTLLLGLKWGTKKTPVGYGCNHIRTRAAGHAVCCRDIRANLESPRETKEGFASNNFSFVRVGPNSHLRPPWFTKQTHTHRHTSAGMQWTQHKHLHHDSNNNNNDACFDAVCVSLPRGLERPVQFLVMRNKAMLKPLPQKLWRDSGEIGYRHVVITFTARNA